MRKKLELKTPVENTLTFEQIVDRVKKVLLENESVVIFGAGTLAKQVCDVLDLRTRLSLICFVDNRVGAVFEPFDEPVYTVYHLEKLKFDLLLLLHPTAEPEMRAQALSYGVPADKIKEVFSG